MKGFARKDLQFSLCGLNCALCVMKLDGYCPGCGDGAGNQGCSIARCSLERSGEKSDGMDYCFACERYPCQRYQGIDQYDSFITHRKQLADMDKAKNGGLPSYHHELAEKAAILKRLLGEYNDGRRKTFFCLAVNLLELSDVQEVFKEITELVQPSMTVKEKAAAAVQCFEQRAGQRSVVLKLNKKQK